MTLAADPPSAPDQPAPPRDPADYGRRRPMGATLWLLALFGVVCAMGGGALALLAPKLFPPAAPVANAPPSAAPALPTAPSLPSAVAPLLPSEPAPPSAEVTDLRNRVEALESAQSRSANAAASTLAAGALVEASRGSRPFVDELAAVDRLLPPSAETRSLHSLAETGAPSRTALAEDFEPAAARAAVAARAPTDGAGLVDQIAFAFASIIAVRRVNVVTGDSPDAVLARAEQLVADGDIDGALVTLERLPPKAREAMSGWRGRAERRAAIDRAVSAIRAAALADLSRARQ